MAGDDSDIDTLRRAVAEYRRAYDKQVEAINKVDDRALRTGRTAVIVLGIAGSVIAAVGPESIEAIETEVRWLMGIGMGCIFLSVVASYLTFGTTNYPSGVGEAHLALLNDDAIPEENWLRGTLTDYQNWQEETNEVLEENIEDLEATMTFLVLGMFLVVFSLLLSFVNQIHGIEPVHTVSAIVALLIISIVGVIALGVLQRVVKTVRGYIRKYVQLLSDE